MWLGLDADVDLVVVVAVTVTAAASCCWTVAIEFHTLASNHVLHLV